MLQDAGAFNPARPGIGIKQLLCFYPISGPFYPKSKQL
jgi:hypothetical protein